MSELVNLSPVREERIKHFLKKVSEADDALSTRRERVAEYIRMYESQPTGMKVFPFVGASNVYIPMVAIARDAIRARILNAILGQDQDFNVEPIVEGPVEGVDGLTWRDVSEALQEYILFEVGPNGQVPFRDHVNDIIDDISLAGTAFPSVSWATRTGFDLVGGSVVSTLEFDNIELRCPSLDHVIFPNGYELIERLPFISEKYVARPSEILARVDSLGWPKSAVREFLREKGGPVELSDFDQVRAEIDDESCTLYTNEEIWLVETWGKVDLDGSGREIPLVIDHTLEPDPRIFRVMTWPYAHRKPRFIQPVVYERRKGKLLGRGIAEIGAHANEAINTILNQIIDRGTLANTVAWSVDENVVSLEDIRMWQPGQPIARGDNPAAIQEIRVGDTSAGLFEGLNVMFSLFEKLIKVSDYDLGREAEQVGQQGTATATLALLQQSGQFFDTIVRQVRQGVNREASLMLNLIAQFRPFERIAMVLGRERALKVVAALSMEPRELNKRLGMYVAFSKDAASRELQRQQEIMKIQVVDAYYTKIIQATQLYVENPFMRPGLLKMGKDAHLRMRRLLESMGETYNNKLLPSLEDFTKAIDVMDAQLNAQGTSLSEVNSGQQGVASEPQQDAQGAGAVGGVARASAAG